MSKRYKVLSIAMALLTVTIATLAVGLSRDLPCGSAGAPPVGGESMKAMVYRCYGSPDVLKSEHIALPAADDNRVIVKVKAASVNPLDWHYLRGKPYEMRALGAGWGAPDDIRLGTDFAGTIESVGRNVTRFKPGDDVYGGGDGSFAQFISVRGGGSLSMKPTTLTYAQAAAVPIAAVTALEALLDKGHVQPGQKVLINGASGGVGTFAVQIAKALGADVTGVCSTKNMAMVRAIGADHVIDYTREDFTQAAQRYDLIIDNVATHSLTDYRRVLQPKGALVMVGGQDNGPWMAATMLRSIEALALSPFIGQRFLFLLAQLDQSHLDYLSALIEARKITPVIDRTYPLEEVPAALRYLEQGHARGKVVIDID